MKIHNYLFHLLVLLVVFTICIQAKKHGYLAIDSFYHVRMSEQFWTSSYSPRLLESDYEQVPSIRHYMFHGVLSVFAHIDRYIGPYAFIFIALCFLFVAIDRYIKSEIGVQMTALTYLCLGGSILLSIRLLQIRPISISLIFVFLIIQSLAKNCKYRCFLYSFLFSIFYLTSTILLVFVTIHLLIKTFHSNASRDYYPELFCLLGLFSALLILPGFPHSLLPELTYFYNHLFIPEYNLLTPGDWESASIGMIVELIFPLAAIALFSISLNHSRYNTIFSRSSQNELFIYANFAIWLVFFLCAKRFVDYFYIFAVLSTAVIIHKTFRSRSSEWTNIIPKTVTIFVFFVILINYTIYSRICDREAKPIDRLKETTHVLNEQFGNSTILLASINSYPELFYNTDTIEYYPGLDVNFTTFDRIEFGKAYVNTFSKKHKNPGLFLAKYKFDYLLVDYTNCDRDLLDACLSDELLKLVYSDKNVSIFVSK